jgi:hypothetical protein
MAQDQRELSGLTVKVKVDVAEAITGLKALQREAKKATAALRELEAAQQGAPVITQNITVTTESDAEWISGAMRRYAK